MLALKRVNGIPGNDFCKVEKLVLLIYFRKLFVLTLVNSGEQSKK